ncbi:hypothetical protein K8R78_04770 [bacterium]|nr:hypothetical protein [bacterium]
MEYNYIEVIKDMDKKLLPKRAERAKRVDNDTRYSLFFGQERANLKTKYGTHAIPFMLFKDAITAYIYGNPIASVSACMIALDSITFDLISAVLGREEVIYQKKKRKGDEIPMGKMYKLIIDNSDKISLSPSIVGEFENRIYVRDTLAHPRHEG